MLFHALLMVVLALTLQIVPRGNTQEPLRSVGVVIKHHTEQDGEYYEDQSDAATANTSGSTTAAANPLDDATATDASAALPASLETLGLGNPESGSLTGASGMLGGVAGTKAPSRGQARAGVFNTFGEGYKFVYVFDRSGSMGGSGRNALSLAQAELIASLESLGDIHQFQIIFYNENPTVFPLAGQTNKLVFANAANKQRAVQFIRGIVADGGTHHESALNLALNMRPDVIFFLTDADRPELTPSQLQRIANRNRSGTVINAIEFGIGPSLGDENFLMRLAKQNGGSYSYVDVTGGARAGR